MQLGKPASKVMADTVFRFTGAGSRRTLVGPRPGVDVSILDIGNGLAMVVSCDPISLVPSIGPRDSAMMSIYEVASDVATSGIAPRYVLFDLNLPPQISDSSLKDYWKSTHETCLRLGLSILGGHTGRFEGCGYSIVGSATMWAICRRSQYLTSQMARDGDELLLTKSAAFGATSVLARAFPRTVRKAIGGSLFRRAWKYLFDANVVTDAITASAVGIHNQGVTAMHDATEGGVLSAVLELAGASGLGAFLDLESIPITDETREICNLFRIDPLTSLGEGSLLIASRPIRTTRIIDRLASKGIEAHLVGRLSSRVEGVYGTTRGRRLRIRYPTKDPYWGAYWKAVHKGWS